MAGVASTMIMLAESMQVSGQQWMILLGLLGLVTAVAITMWRGKPLPDSPRARRRDFASPERTTAQIRDDLETLLVEVQKLSDRLERRLDEKNTAIQDAIKDADQRIFAMRALVQAMRENPPAAAATPNPVDERTQRIYDLADQGRAAIEIAQKLEEPLGEVELILNLRKTFSLAPEASRV